MKTVTFTDAELQRLIGRHLNARLRAEGFSMGAPEAEPNCIHLPVFLNLAGECSLHRSEEGVWTITQETYPEIAERVAASREAHCEAIASAARRAGGM